MAQTVTDQYLLRIIQFLVLVNIVIAGPNGLTMKLIHRDSIDSPLYPGNLTYEQRIQRQADQSKARMHYLTASRINPNDVRLPTIFEGYYYIALVGIGNFPGKTPNFQNYYMMIDSGSELVWTQCEGAEPSFKQSAPLFPYTQSSTFHRVPCDIAMDPPPCEHEMCVNGLCNYTEEYGSQSHTSGALATERFTLTTEDGGIETIDNVIFGCGLEQKDFHPLERPGVENEVAGILGIGGGPKSFLTQLGDQGQGKFSYCFQPWTDGIATNTYLRFGADADITTGGVVQTIPIAMLTQLPVFYYLDLDDISVDNRRLHIPEGWLKLYRVKETGLLQGGCVIDSGNPWTILHERIFNVVENAVMNYYSSNFAMSPMDESEDPRFVLCFQRPAGFDHFPTIKFHFEGGVEYTMNRDNAFYVADDKFCLAFGLDQTEEPYHFVVIGAWQTTNHRFLYDVDDLSLSFVEEDCHMGA